MISCADMAYLHVMLTARGTVGWGRLGVGRGGRRGGGDGTREGREGRGGRGGRGGSRRRGGTGRGGDGEGRGSFSNSSGGDGVCVEGESVCFARTLSRKTFIEVSLLKRNQSFMEQGAFGAL